MFLPTTLLLSSFTSAIACQTVYNKLKRKRLCRNSVLRRSLLVLCNYRQIRIGDIRSLPHGCICVGVGEEFGGGGGVGAVVEQNGQRERTLRAGDVDGLDVGSGRWSGEKRPVLMVGKAEGGVGFMQSADDFFAVKKDEKMLREQGAGRVAEAFVCHPYRTHFADSE